MRLFIAAACICLLAGFASAETKELKTEKEKLSYSMGFATGTQMKRQSIEVDSEVFTKGMMDVISGGQPLMTEQQIQETLMNFQKELQMKQAVKVKEQGEKNKKEGEVFLADNMKKEGVKTLPSGLQYKVITEGKGKKPTENDTIEAHYKGTLIDGTEFDSSYKRGQSATFPVKGVIKGWTEALQLMNTGSKWQLFIPSNLAYGEQGAPGGSIGPNATLIFEVELISIKDSAEKKPITEPKAKTKK
jgi:FKBP-type peptidyl-prolyl cis-trans isomerase FklB